MPQEEANGRLNLYDDVTPLPKTNSVNVLLEAIRKKTRGADVREAIVKAIEIAYETGSSNGNANLEVSKARGFFNTLSDRLENLDSNLSKALSEVATSDSRIDGLIANAGNGTVPSELTDMRVAFDGKTYDTAGKAVREQMVTMQEIVENSTKPDGNQLLSVKYSSNNIINKLELIKGFYVDTSGVQKPSADWYVTDYLPIAAHEYLNLQAGVGLSSWYSADKTFISSFTPNGPVKVPAGAYYLRSSILNTNVSKAYIVDGQRNMSGEYADTNGHPVLTKMPYRDGFQKFTVRVNKSKPVNTTANDQNYERFDFEDVECHLYMPSNFYSPYGKPCKLLMFCHGAGKGAIQWQENAHYVAMIKAFSSNGYFVFDCNGFSNDALGCSFWGDQRGLTAWRKAYQYVTDNYNVEKEFSIYAFSMGGLTALNLAFQGLPNVKSIALGSPVTNLEAAYRATDGTQNVIKTLYGLDDTWDEKKVKGSNPFSNIVTIGDKKLVLKTLPPIKVWYGSTETGNVGNPAVEKEYAKELVEAIVAGGGTAEYREVLGGVHSLSYGGNQLVTNEIITYLNRFSWGGE
ncbi:alpha/beta hydrolase family protein [Streptococcus pluranimalium]|uniref:alpha/beta hydrolase family protein n=1 Tax=Streptococcus pluranimalium TaxID=82348 RepID=UPI003F68BB8F